MRRNSGLQTDQAPATSPPLGGVSECFHGRSSDLQAQPYLPDFPGVNPVSSSAFVPAYRCGAVPEFHRIPFSLSTMERPRMGPTISRRRRFINTYRLWIIGVAVFERKSRQPSPPLKADPVIHGVCLRGSRTMPTVPASSPTSRRTHAHAAPGTNTLHKDRACRSRHSRSPRSNSSAHRTNRFHRYSQSRPYLVARCADANAISN
jgi:hypothetical protein